MSTAIDDDLAWEYEDYNEPGYCYNCGADHPSECHCCDRCQGSGNVVYTDLEWDYVGPDYGPCPKCGGM